MKSNSILVKHFLKAFLFVSTFLLLTISCSTDEIKDPELQESEMEEMQEPNNEGMENPDKNEEPNNLPTSGKIEFEENFILEEDRLFVNHVLSLSEYNS